LVNKITYPDGGWVSYTWGFPSNPNTLADFDGANGSPAEGGGIASGACAYEYSNPVIVKRQVGYFTGASAVQTQTFQYATQWDSTNIGTWDTKTTTVTTTDNVTGLSSKATYTYGPTAAPVQVNSWSIIPPQIPVETSIQTYDLATASPTLLKTENETWIDQYKMSSDQILIAGGESSENVYCYADDAMVLEKDEYDFGVSGPNLSQSNPTPQCGTPTPSRKTVYAYTISSSPCMVVVYNSSGTRISETDEYLDGGTSTCSSAMGSTQTVSGLISGTHDETNYGPTANVLRGNPTSVVRWLNTGSALTTSATYDETGQILTSVDACGHATCSDMTGTGHTTTYSYTDNFASGFGTPSGATNAYVTSVTLPSPNGSPLKTTYSYRFSDGQVSSVTDANSNTTNYSYVVPSTGSPDPLNRLGKIIGPPDPNNGNQSATTTFSYNDAPAASPSSTTPSVTTTQTLSTSGTQKSTLAILDGMGHTVQTQLSSDPAGTDTVATTYDGLGRVVSTTNPYRSSTDPTYVTTYTYDAIGRKIIQGQPDGSKLQWCYDGIASSSAQTICAKNASSMTNVSWVDSSDETGRHWQHASDGLGRLVAAMEPDPVTNVPSLETDYMYDVLGNLWNVTQKGSPGSTAHFRSFTYDSLSRLLCSSNPENSTAACPQSAGTAIPSGTVSYSYDPNGNVSTKTDARGITVGYSYDALNRLLSKVYTNDPFATASSCYQYDTSSVPGAGGNLVGRLTNEWTQKGSCPSAPGLNSTATLMRRSLLSYDVMGRLLSEQQCTKSNCATGTPYNPVYDYDLAGNLIHHSNGIGTLTFTNCYNGANQLLLVVGVSTSCSSPTGATLFSSPSYTAAGGLSAATYGTGLTISRTYDSRLRITGETDTGSSATNPTPGTAKITITGIDKTQ
jgi:YD repeat-containing protein